MLESGLIEVEDVKIFPANLGLDGGEASAIALAKRKKSPVVLDDRIARVVAKELGVEVVHTTCFIFRFIEKRVMTVKEAEQCLGTLLENGWWCSPEAFLRIHNKIRSYEQKGGT